MRKGLLLTIGVTGMGLAIVTYQIGLWSVAVGVFIVTILLFLLAL